MPSIQEMISEMRHEHADEMARTPNLPVPEAQAHTLQAVIRNRDATLKEQLIRPFQRGEQVRYIQGAGNIRLDIIDNLVLVFWRPLDMRTVFDQRLVNMMSEGEMCQVGDVDCLLAFASPDGRAVFNVSNSELLERVPQAGNGVDQHISEADILTA